MEKIRYYLVLEKRPGDYNLVDINKLTICHEPVTNDIASIDGFTSKFTEEEIKKSIAEANIVQTDYLNGKLKVISDLKHNLRALTKAEFQTIIEIQNKNEEIDRILKDKLYGYYKKIILSLYTDIQFINRLLEEFNKALKNNDKIEIFKLVAEIPYEKGRSIYFMIFDEVTKNKEKKIEDTDKSRKLEKLKDVA